MRLSVEFLFELEGGRGRSFSFVFWEGELFEEMVRKRGGGKRGRGAAWGF